MGRGSKCKHCNEYIEGTNKKMNAHLVACESKRPYVCDALTGTKKCGRRFPSARALGTHKGAFHTAAEKGSLYNCMHCSHGTDNLSAFNAHQERCGRGSIQRRSRSRGASVSRAGSVQRESSVASRGGGRGKNKSRGPSASRSNAQNESTSSSSRASRGQKKPRGPSAARSVPATPVRRDSNNKDSDDDANEPTTTPRSARHAPPPQQQHGDDDDYETDSFATGAADDDAFALPPLPAAIIDEQGMYNLSLLDPAATRLVMYEQHKAFDDLMERMRPKLEQLKEIVAKNPNLPEGVVNLQDFEDRLNDYELNHTAEALEQSGRINYGIAQRAAEAAAATSSLSLSETSSGSGARGSNHSD